MRKQNVLEGYLSFWEDTMFITNIYGVANNLPNIPTIESSIGFRDELLAAYTLDHKVNLERFVFPDTPVGWMSDETVTVFARNLNTAPLEIFDWTRSSRRIFELGAEMQHSFENISVADIPIDDILWPFDSFVVKLATPIKRCQNNICAILVSKPFRYQSTFNDPDSVVMMVSLLSDNLTAYKPINSEEKRRIRRSFEYGGGQRARKFLSTEAVSRMRNFSLYGRNSVLLRSAGENSIRNFLQIDIPDEEKTAIQILLNMLLYLEARELRGSVTNWSRQSRVPGCARNIITDAMNVCQVTNINTLKELAENVDRYLSRECTEPHWRRGHSRRKPGEGQDPMAPRSVRVKPTLVRPDLIPTYGLVAGTTTKV